MADNVVTAREGSPQVRTPQVVIEDSEIFAAHEGGKLSVALKSPLDTQRALSIAYTPGVAQVSRAIAADKTLAANGMTDGVHVRVMVTRGIKKTPSQDPRLTISGPNLVIIAEHKTADPASRERGVRLFTSSIRRGSPDYLDPRLNCHSKLHEVMALVQALEAGADEALMLDIHGFVATCNATNFFIVHGDEVWTSTGQYCMNGITRGKVLELGEAAGITCRQKNFSLFDVYGADEAFVTGTFGGLTPVTSVDGRPLGDSAMGQMTRRLQSLYEAAIETAVAEAARSS